MTRNRAAAMKIPMIATAAVLLAALVTAGACSKREGPPEQETAVAATKAEAGHKGEHEEKDGHKESDEHRGTVELTPEAVRAAGIEVAKAVAAAPSEMIGATAVVELNGDRVARVNPRVTGRCINVLSSLGDKVHSGQPLAQVDSVEVDQAWSDYLKAKAQLELATRSVRREETLFAKKVSPEKDLLKARQEQGQAEAEMLLAREKFRLLGVEVEKVDANTSGTTHNHPLIPVPAPLSGTIVDKTVTQGEMVGPEKTIFTIADLSTLWLMIDIYERDIGRVRTGMEVKLNVSTYPGKEFRGRISYIADIMDEKSRTVKARVTIENGDGLLKPGMFASTSIHSGKETAGRVIAVPEEAVFLDGSDRYVFIRERDNRFVVREVLVGPASGGKIEIKEGLKAGEAVVTKGVFALKSEFKKKSLEVHQH